MPIRLSIPTNGWFPGAAPCYISWSANRSTGPVPAARNSTREFRSPDPMCNPYLTFAAMLAAGLDGIRNKVEPPESIDTNIYHPEYRTEKEYGIEMLPANLMEAQMEARKGCCHK